jgi:hypothetical protein
MWPAAFHVLARNAPPGVCKIEFAAARKHDLDEHEQHRDGRAELMDTRRDMVASSRVDVGIWLTA